MTAAVIAGPGSYLAVPELKSLEAAELETAIVHWADRASRVLYELSTQDVISVIATAHIGAEVGKLRRVSKKAQFAAQRIYVVANRRWGELLNAEANDRAAEEARLAAMTDEEREQERLERNAQRKQKERAKVLAKLDDARFDAALARTEKRVAGPTVGGVIAEARTEAAPDNGVEIRITLSAERLEKLDGYASTKGWSRSEVVGKLIERLV
jgi:hypothetical protein